MTPFERPIKLDGRARSVATFKQQLAEHETRLGPFGIFLQRILQMQNGRPRFLVCNAGARLVDLFLGTAPARARSQQEGQGAKRCKGCLRAAAGLHVHGFQGRSGRAAFGCAAMVANGQKGSSGETASLDCTQFQNYPLDCGVSLNALSWLSGGAWRAPETDLAELGSSPPDSHGSDNLWN